MSNAKTVTVDQTPLSKPDPVAEVDAEIKTALSSETAAALWEYGKTRAAARVRVEIPGFDLLVFARAMTIPERSRLEADLVADSPDGLFVLDSDPAKFRAALVKYCAVDEYGAPLFGDRSLEEIKTLAADVVEPFVSAALELNKFGKDATASAKKK